MAWRFIFLSLTKLASATDILNQSAALSYAPGPQALATCYLVNQEGTDQNQIGSTYEDKLWQILLLILAARPSLLDQTTVFTQHLTSRTLWLGVVWGLVVRPGLVLVD